MNRRIKLLGLLLVLLTPFFSGCEEEAVIGAREDAGAIPGDDAAVMPGEDAAIPMGDGGVEPLDAAMPDASTGSDAAVVPEGLAHLEMDVTHHAAESTFLSPEARLDIRLQGLAQDPETVESTPTPPIETFGPCRVEGGGTPPLATSFDFGEGTVTYQVGDGPRQPLERFHDASDPAFTTGRYIYSARVTPPPPVGTVVRTFVRIGATTYEASVTVTALEILAPEVTRGVWSYEVADTSGDLLVSWTPNGEPSVEFANYRSDLGGPIGISVVSCTGDASTSSFTIPSRIVARYMLNLPETLSEFFVSTRSRDVTSHGELTIGAESNAWSRSTVWPAHE